MNQEKYAKYCLLAPQLYFVHVGLHVHVGPMNRFLVSCIALLVQLGKTFVAKYRRPMTMSFYIYVCLQDVDLQPII